MKYILVLLMLGAKSYASIEVAFIEIRNHEGEVVQLEPNGKFAHVAISYRGQWIHSYPFRGVEIISTEDLQRIGRIKTVLKISETEGLNEDLVKTYLGKPYDSEFSWSDDKIYCSELVGKLLNIQPSPMRFETQFWSERFNSLQDRLGLSPDDVFRVLKEKYKPQLQRNQCSKVFKQFIYRNNHFF